MTKEDETLVYSTIKSRPPPIWKVTPLPGLDYRPAGDMPVPNAFQRMMQRLFFGFKWERL